jgi:V8-like Glu-specific endopeptidase
MSNKNSRRLLAPLLLCLMLQAASARAAWAQESTESYDKRAEEMLPQLSNTRPVSDGRTPSQFPAVPVRWVWPYTHPTEVGFLKLRIRAHRFSAYKGWKLRVLDKSDALVEELDESSFFGEAPETRLWTKRIPGYKVKVQLVSPENPVGLDLEVEAVFYDFFKPGPRAITTGRNDMEDLVAIYKRTSDFYKYSQPVAAVFFVRLSGTSETNCTGFLLAPRYFITNHHCISQEWQLKGASVVFNYERNPPQQETFGVTRIAARSPKLDYSLLELDRPADAWSTVKVDLNQLSPQQPLVVIEHPNRKYKIVSVKDCDVEAVTVTDFAGLEKDFYHRCDTEGGASGSPVMNRSTGRVVGLHHLGISDPLFNQGRNLAVGIGAILADIEPQDHAAHAQIMQHVQ